MLSAVKDAAVKVDLLFYIDHRSRFVKDVLLIDIAADIVAVQHPVYPRDSWGFCNQMSEGPGTNTAGVHCEYPYERNKQSSASIPDEVGKFVQKGKNKWSNGKNQRFCVTTGWYVTVLEDVGLGCTASSLPRVIQRCRVGSQRITFHLC